MQLQLTVELLQELYDLHVHIDTIENKEFHEKLNVKVKEMRNLNLTHDPVWVFLKG